MGTAVLSRLSFALALAIAGTACVRAGDFHCTTDADCVLGGAQGRCELVGYCSFPDPACADGSRFGDQSGSDSGKCVDGGGEPVLVNVGGDVSGLTGSGLILRDNGSDDLAISDNGPFVFASEVVTGDPYTVTVGSQPSSPSQTCSVANGAGTAGFVDITGVGISCATSTYVVGGTVIGLVGTGMVLTNNGGDDKSITANGTFMFATHVASGSMFDVAIKTQPSGQTCNVSGNTGTVGSGDVNSVVVNCLAGTYTIGGTISGLEGAVVLRDNGSDNLTLTSNGSFAFPTPLATSATYAVTVLTQPSYPPRSQTCVVTSGSGTVASANITSVNVTCTTNTFSVGGTVSGLSGTLVLKDNAVDTLSITMNGMFTFGTHLASGTTYAVTIGTQPSGQTCAITGGASGTVTSANITNVTVSCAMAGSDPGILCGASYCDPATSLCCITNGVPACATSCGGGGTVSLKCDDQADCAAAGTPQLVCCGSVSGNTVNSIYCGKETLCTAPKAYYCDPLVAVPCPDGGTCTATQYPFPGYYRCF